MPSVSTNCRTLAVKKEYTTITATNKHNNMKAIQITEPGTIKLVELDKPTPGAGEILLKVNFVGYCGSDLSTFLGKNPMVSYPRIPGHEIAASIESLGEGVPASFAAGQQVTVVPYTSCGQCASCRRGRHNACQNNQTLGVQRDGAMAEYIVAPWQKVLKAEGLSNQELALIEPLTVGFHAIDRGRVTDIDTVMVLGCGMIGVGAIVRAALRGAKVIAVDIDDVKLATAKKLGATHTINSMTQDLAEEVAKITDSNGADVIVEAAGNPITYLAAIEQVAFTGRVVCIGYAAKDIAFTTKLFVQKEMDIMGSRNATASDFSAVIKYLQRGTFPVPEVVTRIAKPEEAAEAAQTWANDPGKVLKVLVEFA